MTSAYALWTYAENARWFWLIPTAFMSITALYYMALLSAPRTFTGTLSRVLFVTGFAGMLGSVFFDLCGWSHNGLARFSVLFLMGGAVLLIRQIALACIKDRRWKFQPGMKLGERVLASLVQHD